MTVTALPTPPQRTDAPADFVNKADAFIAALPAFVTELNAAISTVNASVAGGGARAVYTFNTTTTATPASGTIRFNNATHMSATQVFVHETPASGSGSPNFCALMDASTSAYRGILKVSEVSTPTDYIYFKVTNGTDNGTDWTYDVAPLFASAASPIGAVSCNVDFWPVGDAGSVSGGVAMSNANITGIKEALFNGEIANATTTGAVTINWTSGHVQNQAEPTGTITYTFTAPASTKPCHLSLRIISDGSSTAYDPNWPGTVKWLVQRWTPANNKSAIINFYFDGTTYWASGANEV
jgi:hypothetical protein